MPIIDSSLKTDITTAFDSAVSAIDTLATAWGTIVTKLELARESIVDTGAEGAMVRNRLLLLQNAGLDRFAQNIAGYMRHKGVGMVLELDRGPAARVTDPAANIAKQLQPF